jgi:hypothetical protein
LDGDLSLETCYFEVCFLSAFSTFKDLDTTTNRHCGNGP